MNKINKYKYLIITNLLIVVLSVVFTYFYLSNFTSTLGKRALNFSKSMALSLDSNVFANLENKVEDNYNPSYITTRNKLLKIGEVVKNFNIKWVYTMTKIDDKIVFQIDSISTQDFGHSEPGEVYESATSEMLESVDLAIQKQQSSIVGPYSDEWGKFISVVTPIVDPSNGQTVSVLGIDVDYNAFFLREIYKIIAMSVVLTSLLILVISNFFIYRVKILESLSQSLKDKDKLQNLLSTINDTVIIVDHNFNVIEKINAREDVFEVDESVKNGSTEYLNKINQRWYSVKLIKLNESQNLLVEHDITEERKTIEELKEKNSEIEKMNKLMINRELKMAELKEKINEINK